MRVFFFFFFLKKDLPLFLINKQVRDNTVVGHFDMLCTFRVADLHQSRIKKLLPVVYRLIPSVAGQVVDLRHSSLTSQTCRHTLSLPVPPLLPGQITEVSGLKSLKTFNLLLLIVLASIFCIGMD